MKYVYLLEFVSNIRRLQKEMYDDISREIKMNSTSIEILSFLYDNPEKNTALDVCSLKNMKPSLVSFHVEKLVLAGYLSRESVAGDRRKVGLKVTEKAREVVERCHAAREAVLSDFLSECSEDELDTVRELIVRLNKKSQKILNKK